MKKTPTLKPIFGYLSQVRAFVRRSAPDETPPAALYLPKQLRTCLVRIIAAND